MHVKEAVVRTAGTGVHRGCGDCTRAQHVVMLAWPHFCMVRSVSKDPAVAEAGGGRSYYSGGGGGGGSSAD
jgi:hypothetical protein